jgi:SAM-dependent methyltransferase
LVARVQILDVGAGHGRDFGPDAYVVALDISEAALALNTSADEKIVADLEAHELPRNRFDRIVCNDVLEHLRNPRAAISKMASALKVGGVLELGFPDVTSRKARISKLTPHWFHVLGVQEGVSLPPRWRPRLWALSDLPQSRPPSRSSSAACTPARARCREL